MKTDKEYQIILPKNRHLTTKGRSTKLKGYSKFNFFVHKRQDKWHVREFSTGLRLGSGTTEAEAKRVARKYLKEKTGGNLELFSKQIDKQGVINTVI